MVIAAALLTGCSGSSSPPSLGPAGDASHPPPAVATGQQAAPTDLAAPLLTAADLGPTWRAGEVPPVGYSTPPPFDVGPPAIYQLRTDLQTEHWTGSAWSIDQFVEELATSYGTAAKADQIVILQVAQAKGLYRSAKVHGVTVWTYTSPKANSDRLVWLAVGPLAVKLTIGAPGSAATGVPAARVVRLAVERLKSHPEPSQAVG